jgi:hypothetical protein
MMSAYAGAQRTEDAIGAAERSSLQWARRKIEEVKAGLRDDPGRAYSVEFTGAAEILGNVEEYIKGILVTFTRDAPRARLQRSSRGLVQPRACAFARKS